MFDSKLIDSIRSICSGRPLLALGAAAFLLSGCGDTTSQQSTPSSNTGTAELAAYEDPGDHAVGSVDAPVTFIEYASVSCGACGNWHNTVYPELKKKYIDSGKVRFVFREFLASDPVMAEAGFKIALCGGEENYFKNIAFQFKRQNYIFKQAQQGKMRDAYIGIAKAAGLSEDAFTACMNNETHQKRIKTVMKKGQDMGVSGTPAFFVNGERAQVFTLESIEEIILPILGEEAAKDEPADEAANGEMEKTE